MENLPSIDDQFLQKINQIIEDNLGNENFSVEQLAENVGISRSMLHRKLIKLTGKSSSEFIKEIKLERAKVLLENNVATVSEIAYQVGFRSASYFTNVFKRRYGVSPGDVRKGFVNLHNDERDERESRNNFFSGFLVRTTRSKFLVAILVLILLGSGFLLYRTFFLSPQKSIAVLPLDNLTGEHDNDYFVDGMHDALIGELGHFESLRVISRTSTLRYRKTDKLLKDIAKELGVKNIVEGAVTKVGDSIQILIQLIDVFPRERNLLGKEYQDGLSNVLNLQSSAVKDIATTINLKLSKREQEIIEKKRTVNPETYKAYLRGMYYLNQGTKESFEKGISYLQQAIEKDPGDPFAYAGLAVGYAYMGHGQLDSKESFLRAMAAANKAIKLDPTIDEAYTALSLLYLYTAYDWPLAKQAFENALTNNPNNEIAHAHFAWYYILFNEMDKSIYHAKKAVIIEPFSASYNSWLALLYYHNGEYEKAEYWARKALALKDDIPYGILTLAWISLKRGQYNQAIEYGEKLPKRGDYWNTFRGYIYVRAGQREKAMALWMELEEESQKRWVNPCIRGMMAAYLGFTDKAFELLEVACKNKTMPISYINLYPCTECIRKDPRYPKLLEQLNLPFQGDFITATH